MLSKDGYSAQFYCSSAARYASWHSSWARVALFPRTQQAQGHCIYPVRANWLAHRSCSDPRRLYAATPYNMSALA